MVPLFYLPSDSLTGPRVGGAHPAELASQFRDDVTQYFGTFPLPHHTTKEFSIFHRIDALGTNPGRDAIVHNNQVLDRPDLVWCVIHDCSHRGDWRQNAFEPRGLEMGQEAPDLVRNERPIDSEPMPYSESKLGGSCFVMRRQVCDAIHHLEYNGFQHLLQIGMHGSDLIDGFPWDPGYLNVWARDPLDVSTYRFCIQQ